MSRTSSDPLSALTTFAAPSDDPEMCTGTLLMEQRGCSRKPERRSLPLTGGDLHEESEPVEPFGKDGDDAVHGLERARDDDRRFAVQDALVSLVRRRTDDHVRHPRLVLEREEHVAFRGLGVLFHHHGAGDVDELAVTMVCQIAGAKDPAPLKVVAIEMHHLRAGRDTGDAVIERGPLLLAQRG